MGNDDESGIYCSGDYFPGRNGNSGVAAAPTTTFVLREQTGTLNPLEATPISGCTKQFAGRSKRPQLKELWDDRNDYDRGLAKVFHSWVELCTFTPAREGDYYLQVRTNVSLDGAPEANTSGMIYLDNPAASALQGNTDAGEGLYAFAIRAATTPTLASSVSVAGWSRMPILHNVPRSTAQFNLIRAVPGAAGQYISFKFDDAADGATYSGGTARVIRPTDATGSINDTTDLRGCKGAVNSGTQLPLSNARFRCGTRPTTAKCKR